MTRPDFAIPRIPSPPETLFGIQITSGDNRHDDMTTLVSVVNALQREMQAAIESISCLSGSSMFRIAVRSGFETPDLVRTIGKRVGQLLVEVHGGHDGIQVGNLSIAPEWEDDEDQGRDSSPGVGWPDGGEPGVPAGALLDGIHWLRFPDSGADTIGQWCAEKWCWVVSYLGVADPVDLAHLDYIGACKLP